MARPKIPPSNIPMIDQNGRVTPAWYRFFAGEEVKADAAASGEVLAGDGLAGGGIVADGITLSLADNGTTDDNLRQSSGTSVIGRFENSTGNVADIRAASDNRVLSREGGQLAFRDSVTLVGVKVANLTFANAATASAATPSTHKIAVVADGVTYHLLATT